jgi:cystathionine beta-lyase/cystathionine gamma-synthase
MPERETPDIAIETILNAPFEDEAGSVMPPIHQSSLFTFDCYQAFEDRMAGRSDTALYTRVQNPTVAAFEAMMARAERGDAAVGFASGMAAISSTVLAFLKPGDRVACVEHVYPDAYRLFERLLRPFGINVSYHPVAAFEDDPDILDGAALAYLESPNSLMFQTMDLRKVAGHARARDVLTVADNSWATPVFQRPLDLGIDIVVHSASKYISGHSDTVAGVVIARDDLIGRIRDLTLPLLGAKLAPFEAWLLVRGLRTLAARMRQHQETADVFVDRLSGLDLVERVHSPGANSVPGLTGRAGLMSLELRDNVDVPRLADGLEHFRLGVSWGGFESLILPASVAIAQPGGDNSTQRFGVPPNLVRLSLGLENAEDLWVDFASALSKSAA